MSRVGAVPARYDDCGKTLCYTRGTRDAPRCVRALNAAVQEEAEENLRTAIVNELEGCAR